MDEAIKILEKKRSEWRARAEYHRKEKMQAYADGDKVKLKEEQQLEKLADDTIYGLTYSISLLKY